MTEQAPANAAAGASLQKSSAASTRLPERQHTKNPSGDASTRLSSEQPNGMEKPSRGLVTLEMIVEEVQHLPAMPSVVIQVMKVAQEGGGSTRELAAVVSKDQNFALRILQLANSAYYGLSRNVGTISEAVMLLGARTVRNLAIAAATHDTLNREFPGYELSQGELWRHSMACAIASQILAEMTHYPDKEEAFVAGLLHDMGKVILSIHVGEAIIPIREYMEKNNVSFPEAEQAILGFDHAEVGGRVALKWKLPQPLVQAIAYHHIPQEDSPVAPLTALVHVGNVLCLVAGIGLGIDGLYAQLSQSALETLQLSEEDVEQALDRLTGRIAKAQPLFEMSNMLHA